MIIKPDLVSLSTHQILLYNSEADAMLATGTAFSYQTANNTFLITNWHNVTGKDIFTGEYLKQSGAIPDSIQIYLRRKENPLILDEIKIKLYSDISLTKKIWIEHPFYKEKVDVVAIPLHKNIIEKYLIQAINSNDFNNEIEPEISDDVFVIGYPFQSLTKYGFPIWKKGSIASEPTVKQKDLPLIYIDTATRPGLSGSPVIYQREGIHGLVDGTLQDDTIFGRIRGFLGIYSGRLGKDENLAQLGLIWRRTIIEEMCK